MTDGQDAGADHIGPGPEEGLEMRRPIEEVFDADRDEECPVCGDVGLADKEIINLYYCGTSDCRVIQYHG